MCPIRLPTGLSSALVLSIYHVIEWKCLLKKCEKPVNKIGECKRPEKLIHVKKNRK